MNFNKENLKLYAVTDRTWLGSRTMQRLFLRQFLRRDNDTASGKTDG